MTSGNGILLLGVLWLIFWLFPAFYLFQEDPRWGHNFAIPIIFITVGLAYNINKISCQLTAVIASYLTIPILLAFWPWNTATIITIAFFTYLYQLREGLAITGMSRDVSWGLFFYIKSITTKTAKTGSNTILSWGRIGLPVRPWRLRRPLPGLCRPPQQFYPAEHPRRFSSGLRREVL